MGLGDWLRGRAFGSPAGRSASAGDRAGTRSGAPAPPAAPAWPPPGSASGTSVPPEWAPYFAPPPAQPSPAPASPGDRDEHLTALSYADAREVERLAAESLARHGHPGAVVVDGAAFVNESHRLGLSNIAYRVADSPRSEWPEIVDGFVDVMLTVNEGPSAPIDPDAVYLVLRPVGEFPVDTDTVREYLPGMYLLPAVDFPAHVQNYTGFDSLPWDPAETEARGRRNLAELPAPTVRLVMLLDDDDPTNDAAVYYEFRSDDFFGAARVIVLDELLRRTLSEEVPEYGALIALPNRHTLLVHLLHDAPAALMALRAMAQAAVEEYGDSPGPLAPHVWYLDRFGDAVRLTDLEDTGLRVRIVDELAEALRRLDAG